MFNGGALVQWKVNIWTGHVWESSIMFHMKDEQEDRIFFWGGKSTIGTHIEPLSNTISRTSWMGLLDFDATFGFETGQCTNSLNTLICTLDVIHFSETLHPAILQCMPIRPPIHTESNTVPRDFAWFLWCILLAKHTDHASLTFDSIMFHHLHRKHLRAVKLGVVIGGDQCRQPDTSNNSDVSDLIVTNR